MLRSRVKDLERQLQTQHRAAHHGQASLPNRNGSRTESSSPNSSHVNGDEGTKIFWEGIHTKSALSNETQYYGPSSSFYFIGRISSYLGGVLTKSTSELNMQPNSASKTFASPIVQRLGDLEATLTFSDVPLSESDLTATQEEYFLSLFWESYHCTYQIFNEEDFKKHYKSLWDSSGTSRKPSALVDIVLALSIQLGIGIQTGHSNTTAATKSERRSETSSNDATIAGRFFYRRCQVLLASELESPSISTLQSQLLSLVYLCNASFQNMAHNVSALAIRTAHILGLHLEPPPTLPLAEREFCRRLWWTVYGVEIKTSMKLGRPVAAPISHTNCSLPSDAHEIARASGSSFAPVDEKVSWHSYSLHCTKLILAVHAIYKAFYDKASSILSSIHGRSLYTDPHALETLAEFLQSQTASLDIWLEALPSSLQTHRQNGGKPFSTDPSSMIPEIEPFAPLWLQRQRLILELLYHNLSMNLYRPFVCFPPPSSSLQQSSSPHPETSLPRSSAFALATLSLNHALTLTTLLHTTLTTTQILSGWHEAFQWGWNATLSIAGFLLAYSNSNRAHHTADPDTLAQAKAGLQKAISVFGIMGTNFAVAASAGDVARSLFAKIELLDPEQSEAENVVGVSGQSSTTPGLGIGDSAIWASIVGFSPHPTDPSQPAPPVHPAHPNHFAEAAFEPSYVQTPPNALNGSVSGVNGANPMEGSSEMDGLLEGSMGLNFTLDAEAAGPGALDAFGGFEAIWAGGLFETWLGE